MSDSQFTPRHQNNSIHQNKKKKKRNPNDKRVTIKLMLFCRRAHLSFIEFNWIDLVVSGEFLNMIKEIFFSLLLLCWIYKFALKWHFPCVFVDDFFYYYFRFVNSVTFYGSFFFYVIHHLTTGTVFNLADFIRILWFNLIWIDFLYSIYSLTYQIELSDLRRVKFCPLIRICVSLSLNFKKLCSHWNGQASVSWLTQQFLIILSSRQHFKIFKFVQVLQLVLCSVIFYYSDHWISWKVSLWTFRLTNRRNHY